jgi:phosphotriesterase-related protein
LGERGVDEPVLDSSVGAVPARHCQRIAWVTNERVTAESVLGPIDTGSLGFTLMHEHVAIRTPGFAENYPESFDRGAVVEQAVADASLVAEVSRRSGMNIVLTTGSYHFVPSYFRPRTRERISELFVKDLTVGIADTGVRAGLIKCAVDEPGMTDPIRKLTEAAALAQQATGALISTHTSPASYSGLAQAEVLASAGADLSRVVIGHSGDTTDLGYLRALLAMGCSLGLDRFGLVEYLDTRSRCEVVAALCQEGFADRLVLSHDAFCFNDSVSRRYRDQHLPFWRMDHLIDDVLPMLRELGVRDDDITAMTVTNPARLLAFTT